LRILATGAQKLATQLMIVKPLSVQKCILSKTSNSLSFYKIVWLDMTLSHRRVPVFRLWCKVSTVDLKPPFGRFETANDCRYRQE